MTQTITCWLCGATRRIGDNHCCGRRPARAAIPRRRRRSRLAGPALGLFVGLVFWIAAWLVIGVLVWGPWRFV
jgi:hypothetical protein